MVDWKGPGLHGAPPRDQEARHTGAHGRPGSRDTVGLAGCPRAVPDGQAPVTRRRLEVALVEVPPAARRRPFPMIMHIFFYIRYS